jgi:DNA-binding transcriptional ArsR family regulator
MVQYSNSKLDQTFAALSDSTRRGVLLQLGRGDTSITELAEQFHMSLTGMKKHVAILEEVGLVETEKKGRVRTCKLGSSRLESEVAWIEKYKGIWDKRFDALEIIVQELKQKKESK